MRVLHIIDGIGVGGAESVLVQLVEQFERQGVHNIILSMTAVGVLRERIIKSGAELIEMDLAKGRLPFRQILRLVGEVRRARADLIQAWMYHGNFAATVLRILSGQKAPMIWSIHNTLEPPSVFAPVTRIAYSGCRALTGLTAKIVYVSQVSAEQHEKRGFSKAKTYVIPNGTDCSVFKPDVAASERMRDNWNLPVETPAIGCFARWDPMKGHAALLEAASILKERNLSFKLIFAGTGMTRENADLQALAKMHDVTDDCLFLGERQDVPALLAGLDGFILPSIYGEAFPMVLGEAMACELPCIATDVGDVSRLLGPTGYLVPPNDVAALVKAMHEFLLSKPKDRAAEGEKMRARIVGQFSLEKMVSDYMILYQDVLGHGNASEKRTGYTGQSI